MRLQALALRSGFTCHHRAAQHQVGCHHRRLRVVEGQHVGGVVFAPVIAVQRSCFGFADHAHGHLGVAQKGARDPALNSGAGQGGAVGGQLRKVAKLQRQVQRVGGLAQRYQRC